MTALWKGFRKKQQEYLETVDIQCDEYDSKNLSFMTISAMLQSIGAVVLPLVLFDPRWQINSGTDPGQVLLAVDTGPFGWSWNSAVADSEPVHASTWIVCIVICSTYTQFLFLVELARDWRILAKDRKRLFLVVLGWALASGLLVAATYSTWYMPFVRFEEAAASSDSVDAASSDALVDSTDSTTPPSMV